MAIPLTAYAQGGVPGGVERDHERAHEGGPFGAIVGGVLGGVAGGAAAILGVEERPRFHRYVEERHHRSYVYREDLQIGAMLPEEGVEYYEVPQSMA